MRAEPLPIPSLAFDADAVRDIAAGDVYFSAAGGLAETRFVFLQQNDLPARFATAKRFTIGETGFGTGLNFLAAWQAFLQCAPADATLHFLSVEAAPMTCPQLARAHAMFPELTPFAHALREAWPLRIPGWHRLSFGRVVLHLGLGDATARLREMQAQVDAWFLDGFAPAKNPTLWQQDVFSELARLSAPQATFATFTAAATVKHGLETAGFTVEKRKGFAHKRHMLRGQFSVPRVLAPHASPRSVAVIGAGIAGSSAARALAERGCAVTLYDASPAGGASGNPAGVLFPKIERTWKPQVARSFLAYADMLRQLPAWQREGFACAFATCGMLKLPKDTRDEETLRAANTGLGLDVSVAHWCDAEEASHRSGTPLASGGLWFPHGTWVAPKTLCEALVQHPHIFLHRQSVADLHALPHDALILANGFGAQAWIDTPLFRTAGQLSQLPNHAARVPLQAVICHKGYAIPQTTGTLLGATYDHENLALTLSEENHAKNLADAAQFLPHWLTSTDTSMLQGRIANRVTTRDKQPLLGEHAALSAALGKPVYLTLAHGSRGLLSAPYGAQAIAAALFGEPWARVTGA
jgi:tRNA 5-methylaminomethyl-2-thiouridine biosynthesis bifunctional protein